MLIMKTKPDTSAGKYIVPIALTLIILLVFFFSGCDQQEDSNSVSPYTESRDDLLGTIISLTLYEEEFAGESLETVAEQCFELVQDIDNRMSVNNPASEISLLNQKSGMEPVKVSEDTYRLVSESLEFSRQSEGAYDISIGAVMELWKIDESFARLPERSEIAEKLELVGFDNIQLLEDNFIYLEKEGMYLDLGAIAKGFACDRAVEQLKASGIAHGLLDFGGNIYAYGEKPDGSSWRVAVKDPVIGSDGLVCVVEVKNKSVVTSGGYERYFEEQGRIYHHILDPNTGYSVENGLLSVTIVTESSTEADILSTLCFVLGAERGLEFLSRYDDVEGIFITDDKEVLTTSGISSSIQIMDDSYKLH